MPFLIDAVCAQHLSYYLSGHHLASCTKLDLLRAFFTWRELKLLHLYLHTSHTHTPHTGTHLTHAHTSYTHTPHTRTHLTHAHTSQHTRTHTSHTHTHHARTHITHAHTSHTSHTHTPHTRTHTLSSRCVRRMVAHLCDEFKGLKGFTLPCVCTYLQNGATPLCYAASLNRIEVVRHLLSSGADVNKADKVSVRLHWLW